MKHTITASMKAVRQHKPGGELVVEDVPVPIPGPGEVLVKMAASPVNPSDLSFLNGTYVVKPDYPVIPGIEGSGVVVAAGKGWLPALRLGKRVACTANPTSGGTWAQYVLTPAIKVIPLNKNIDLENGSMLIVNPLTALALIKIAKIGRHVAIVNNTAAGVLGKTIAELCAANKIKLINIVRKASQLEELKQRGEKYVLNSESEGFIQELSMLAKQLKATLFLDAVGGKHTSELLQAAPSGSTVMIYGNLSGEMFNVDSRTLIQKDIKIDNFYLGTWLSKRSVFEVLRLTAKAQKLVAAQPGSMIRKTFTIDQSEQAVQYYRENMTGGKILLTFRE